MSWGDGQTKKDMPTDIITYWFPSRVVSKREYFSRKPGQFSQHCRRARCGYNGGECNDGTPTAGNGTGRSCNNKCVQD